jgi:hypothetical protein
MLYVFFLFTIISSCRQVAKCHFFENMNNGSNKDHLWIDTTTSCYVKGNPVFRFHLSFGHYTHMGYVYKCKNGTIYSAESVSCNDLSPNQFLKFIDFNDAQETNWNALGGYYGTFACKKYNHDVKDTIYYFEYFSLIKITHQPNYTSHICLGVSKDKGVLGYKENYSLQDTNRYDWKTFTLVK